MKVWAFIERKIENGSIRDVNSIHYVLSPEAFNEGFYNEVRSYNSFNSKGRYDHKNSKAYRYMEEFNFERDYKTVTKNKQIRHLSIYNFFNHIGYDKKKKKFI